MRKLEETPGKSSAIGPITAGCSHCIEGKKTVLFVTGLCRQNCWYCTISANRWQKDEVWANERLIKTDDELIDEIRKCGSTGVGITGGEPLLVPERVVHFIKLLKKNFGKGFHIHLYTCGIGIDPLILKKLHAAGLDEIRIHKNRELVKSALKFDWTVGMEVPVLPGQENELCELVDWLESTGAHFLNLNELEFSERNVEPMEKQGLKLKEGSLTAVAGSAETAMKVLKYAQNKKLNVHFCTAALKLNYQLRNRLKNRARNIKKSFEKITKDGFLLKGVIFGANLEKIKSELMRLKLPEKEFYVSIEKNRVEISAERARHLANKLPFKVAVVEEYPTAEPWDFELTPLNY
ncbi:MAG: radical SAM protein [Candidatus Aenigmatarchaeota archaeon]